MRTKGLLAGILLGVGLCFVPAVGYGEIEEWMSQSNASYMEISLEQARIGYIMLYPDTFLLVTFLYDPYGDAGVGLFPARVDTKNKIIVGIRDTRDVFARKSERTLLRQFQMELEIVYSLIRTIATDMDSDIVATFLNEKTDGLGYFYQGEYHLWER